MVAIHAPPGVDLVLEAPTWPSAMSVAPDCLGSVQLGGSLILLKRSF
ncbi:MAG: hypothetical protein ACXVDF_16590 [Ktedonobacterales bacterium]